MLSGTCVRQLRRLRQNRTREGPCRSANLTRVSSPQVNSVAADCVLRCRGKGVVQVPQLHT